MCVHLQHLRSDISIYSEIELTDANNNNSDSYLSDSDSNSPLYCDNNSSTEGGSTTITGDDGERKKPILMRTASLGSWERPIKSGRFSVSPVDVSIDENSPSNPDIQISVNLMAGMGTSMEESGGFITNVPMEQTSVSMQVNMCQQPTPVVVEPSAESDQSSDDDEDNGSDMSQNETDQLADLPTKDMLMMGMSRLLPPQRSFRRMSSPAITAGITVATKPKPKPNLQLKLSGNLESLDLKSSLPLSPTFFAKFGMFVCVVDYQF